MVLKRSFDRNLYDGNECTFKIRSFLNRLTYEISGAKLNLTLLTRKIEKLREIPSPLKFRKFTPCTYLQRD